MAPPVPKILFREKMVLVMSTFATPPKLLIQRPPPWLRLRCAAPFRATMESTSVTVMVPVAVDSARTAPPRTPRFFSILDRVMLRDKALVSPQVRRIAPPTRSMFLVSAQSVNERLRLLVLLESAKTPPFLDTVSVMKQLWKARLRLPSHRVLLGAAL